MSNFEVDMRILPLLKRNPVLFSQKICRMYPYWYQKAILQCDAKNIAARLSRQTGKTWVLALKGLHAAFTKIDALDPDDEYVVMIFAPTQKQSNIMFSAIRKIIDSTPILGADIDKKIQTEIRFRNESVIYNYPIGEAGHNVRGFSVDTMIIDEAAYIPDEAFDSLIPALAATDGNLWISSTPRARFGYFYKTVKAGLDYKEYLKRKKAGLTGISKMNMEEEVVRRGLFHHPGQAVTFWFPYSVGLEVERMDRNGKPTGRTQLTERIIESERVTKHPVQFAKEYMARFTDESCMYFPLQMIINATEDYPMITFPRPGYSYWMGVDFAKVQDFYIALVLESPPDEGPLRIAYWQVSKKRDYSVTVPRTAQIAKLFGVKTVYCDETGVGAPNVEKLKNLLQGISRVEGIIMSNKKQSEMYANVFELLGSKRLILPAINRELLNQLQLVTMEELPGGGIRIEAAAGSYDDYPDALALACLATLEPRHELFFTSTKGIFSEQIDFEAMEQTLGTQMVGVSDSRVIRDYKGNIVGILPKDWQ